MLCNIALASSTNKVSEIIQKSLDRKLYQQPQWLRLLHIPLHQADKKFQRSHINSPNFFIVKKTQDIELAKKELMMTIELMFSASTKNSHQIICKYPARYAWLKQKLNVDFEKDFSYCTEFLQWSALNSLDSVSLLLVSGYLGNPASTFGHSLIKFNTAGSHQNSLLDVAINFGALTPTDEPIPVYIAKGLAGGYQARFSEQRYFAEEINYSDLEQRDMWEYELKLTEYQKQLLTGHIWELLGQEFTYYFFEENCAYRVTELLELTYEQNFLPSVQQWYAPISLFHTLTKLEESNKILINNIIYHPSPQRELYSEFNQLSDTAKNQFNNFIRDETLSFQSKNKEQPQVLETALKYNTYKLIRAKPTEKNQFLKTRKSLLKQRLQLPPTVNTMNEKKFIKNSPALGSTPARLQASYIHNQQLGSIQRLAASPFYYDHLGNHAQDGSELIVMNLEIDRYVADHSVRLSTLELLTIQKIDLDTAAIHGEKNYSWRLSSKFENNDLDCSNCFDFNFLAGIGKAKRFKNYFGYGLMNLNYANDEFNLIPTLTLDKVSLKQGLSASIGYNYALNSYEKTTVFSMKYLYRFSQNTEMSVGYLNQADETFNFSVASYF